MSLSNFRNRSDERVANDMDSQRDLMCAAQGCPNLWSVDAGSGRLCSWHGWSAPHLWPQITQAQQSAHVDRAYRAQHQPAPAARSMSRAEKIQIIAALRDLAAQPKTAGARSWAHRIVARHDAGEKVTPLVLRMARDVLQRATARIEEEVEA
jgi:hypothetical protein